MNITSVLNSQNASPEIQRLEKLSLLVFLSLSLIITIAAIAMAFCIEWNLLITSGVMAGIVGSATAALLSSLQRRASGWELEDGTKVPLETENDPPSSKERFSLRMAHYFLFRPFLGIIAGLVVFCGGKSLFGLNTTNPEEFNQIIFYSLLAGLFAKTLIEILKGTFKAFFGKG